MGWRLPTSMKVKHSSWLMVNHSPNMLVLLVITVGIPGIPHHPHVTVPGGSMLNHLDQSAGVNLRRTVVCRFFFALFIHLFGCLFDVNCFLMISQFLWYFVCGNEGLKSLWWIFLGVGGSASNQMMWTLASTSFCMVHPELEGSIPWRMVLNDHIIV